MRRNLRLALLLALASGSGFDLVGPLPAHGEAVLYRTADGQEGIVSDASEVPAGAAIVTERKRAVVRVPAEEIERALGLAPAAPEDEAPAPDGWRRDPLPPPPPGDRDLDAASALDEPLHDELDPELDASDALPAPESLPMPSLSPEDRRAAELAHRERCEKLGLFGYSCTPAAMDEAERWGVLARAAREKRELGEARVAHLRQRYESCSSARASAICPKRELEAAERRVAELERREEQIEDACRRAECLPGWLRL